MTRQEHLEWCKERALKYCDNGQPVAAWLSFRSDMSKHEETRNHIALELGDTICGSMMQSPELIEILGILKQPIADKTRNFIEGFN